MRRRTVVLLVAGLVVVAAPVTAYAYLAWTTRDAPEEAALDAPSQRPRSGGPSHVEGTWAVADVPTNFVGYRIRERLGPVPAPSDAVGRTSGVEGTVEIDGTRLTTLDLTVDLTTLHSDSTGRDDSLHDSGLETNQFPTGSFELDRSVDLGEPDRGRVVEVRVPGRLTLHGVTKRVVFDVHARWDGPTIQTAGSTDIERRDYGIDVSSLGFDIGDSGTIEFELTLAPQGATVASPPSTIVDNPQTPTKEDTLPPCRAEGPPAPLDAPIVVSTYSDQAPIVVVSEAGQTTPLQVSGFLIGGATWSPDGSEILYTMSPALQEPSRLVVVGAAGGAPRPLVDLRDVERPDWGPDGTVVFVKREGAGRGDLWVADGDGSNAHRLVATPGVDADPRWSPDGKHIVFTTDSGTDNQDVAIVDREGRGLRTLAGGRSYEYAPSFTPDGNSVLFVREGAIHRVGLDGNGERQVTDGPDDGNPAMSPDGDQLAFVRAGSLLVANADGTDAKCVPTDANISSGPRWQLAGPSRS